ncbi:hypothetical protein [Kocuria dechangensis]|nr:hypothetical protein [Kocuria dechangensis]
MLRSEDKRVLLHCVQAPSRTLMIVALHGSLVTGAPACEEQLKIARILPEAEVNRPFERELRSPVPSAA